jgi:hypothetical protein
VDDGYIVGSRNDEPYPIYRLPEMINGQVKALVGHFFWCIGGTVDDML